MDFILTNTLSERPLQNQNPSRMKLFLTNVHKILIHSFVNCTLLWTYVKMVELQCTLIRFFFLVPKGSQKENGSRVYRKILDQAPGDLDAELTLLLT